MSTTETTIRLFLYLISIGVLLDTIYQYMRTPKPNTRALLGSIAIGVVVLVWMTGLILFTLDPTHYRRIRSPINSTPIGYVYAIYLLTSPRVKHTRVTDSIATVLLVLGTAALMLLLIDQ